MSTGWLLAVNLGSAAMAGIGLLFAVVWVIDRGRTCALYFAGAIALYIISGIALSLNLAIALAASIHGVLFPVAMVWLADAVLRRVGDRLPRGIALAYLVPSILLVWYFAYVSPLLVGRMITQNLGTAVLLMAVAHRLWKRTPTSGADKTAVSAVTALSVVLGGNAVAALLSKVPHETITDADWDAYLQSNLSLGVRVAATIVLPACMVALLAVTVLDMVEELRFQRDRDELTGLLNRRGFNRCAETLLAGEEFCALVLADLDNFKTVNDTWGHSGGDRVLVAFAAMLSDAGEDGWVIGRLGGEEFAVLQPAVGVESAVAWAESVRIRMVEQGFGRDAGSASVTASFGVAAGQPQTTLTELLDVADNALYRAKSKGRNQTVVMS
ncbi:GGDEF domain-containing protein [Mycolicibacterium diernhoferi]|uniref:GGDEF domain-containing protein n=1 Tax=Mycolicibacterium diernhoferi TaxID=1801 RepID=A0A1Q4HJS5_9MYCO|nr:GGDEF domain-containing protein [Mycolicibacterium diernhoferi]OJZ67774.1 hypothetical protein BRW64_05870 [Mycolicibacterium diernhoferi]OPE54452.1 hypothetical protein BV510_10250 [Mycolicibacterium diernhoferi]PEG51876.1 GGDEF domain-containing protein [Mycolicibacterium diernhoferi]QYL20421.1 GGDEF domain-containing protein [Mycolicibacterium diernhoferi]